MSDTFDPLAGAGAPSDTLSELQAEDAQFMDDLFGPVTTPASAASFNIDSIPQDLDGQQVLATLTQARSVFNPSVGPDLFAGTPELETVEEDTKLELMVLAEKAGIDLDTADEARGIGSKALGAAVRILMVGTNVGVGLVKHLEESTVKAREAFEKGHIVEAWVRSLIINPVMNPVAMKRQLDAIIDNETFKDTDTYRKMIANLPKGDPEVDTWEQTLIELLPGAIELAGDILLDPLTYLTFGTGKAAQLTIREGALAGTKVALNKKGKKLLAGEIATIGKLLVENNGMTKMAAEAFVRDQFAITVARELATKAGQPLHITQRAIMEIVEERAPHLIKAIEEGGSRNIGNFYELATKLTDEELFAILQSFDPASLEVVKRQMKKSLADLVTQAGMRGGRWSIRKKAVLGKGSGFLSKDEFAKLLTGDAADVIMQREQRRLIAAIAMEKASTGGRNGLSEWANFVTFKGGRFEALDLLVRRNPKLINELVDHGGLKFLGSQIATKSEILSLPFIGSGLRGLGKLGKPLGALFGFDFKVPKELRFLKNSVYLAPLQAAKRDIMDQFLKLFRDIDEAAGIRIMDAIEDSRELIPTLTDAGEKTYKMGKITETSADKIALLADVEAQVARDVLNAFSELRTAEFSKGISFSPDQLLFDQARLNFDVPKGVNIKEWKATVKAAIGEQGMLILDTTGTLPMATLKKMADKAPNLFEHAPKVDVREYFLTRMLSSVKNQADFRMQEAVIDKFAVDAVARLSKSPVKMKKAYEKFEFLTKTAVIPRHIKSSLDDITNAAKAGFYSPDELNAVSGLLASVQQAHKWLLTVPFPSFTARNIATNVFNNTIGIGFAALNPRLALHAMGIQLSGTLARSTNFAEFFAKRPIGKALKFEGAKIITDLGQEFSYKVIREMFEDQGLMFATFIGAEVQASRKGVIAASFAELRKGKMTKRLGLWTDLLRGADAHAKFMNFLYHIQRGSSPEAAAAQVRKFLFDYSQVSHIEKTFLRRHVFPFYTYSRKNLGLHMEILVERPGLFSNYKKAFTQHQKELNNEEIPDHMRGMPFITWETEDGKRMTVNNYGMPTDDIVNLFNGDAQRIVEKMASRGNFIAKTMVEMLTMYDFFRGERVDRVKSPESLAALFRKAPQKVRDAVGFKESVDKNGNLKVVLNPRLMILLRNLPTSRILTGVVEPVFFYDDRLEATAHLPEFHPARMQAARQRTTRFTKILSNIAPARIETVDPAFQEKITWFENIKLLEETFYAQGILNKVELSTWGEYDPSTLIDNSPKED